MGVVDPGIVFKSKIALKLKYCLACMFDFQERSTTASTKYTTCPYLPLNDDGVPSGSWKANGTFVVPIGTLLTECCWTLVK